MEQQHVLLCTVQKGGCGERIVLPLGSPLGRSPYQYYWPMDGQTITLVCPNCGLLSVHSESDVHLVDMLPEIPNPLPTVLWRVEFSCDRENCGLPVVVHTRTEGRTAIDEPYRLVKRARPTPSCANGHPLRDDTHLQNCARMIEP